MTRGLSRFAGQERDVNRHTVLPMILFVSWLVAVATPATAQEPRDFVLDSSSDSYCSSETVDRWVSVVEQMEAVEAVDPELAKIGPPAAYKQGILKPLLGKNWYPADYFRQTLCGTLHEFGVYAGLGAEFDWNLFIIPDPAFEYVLEDLKPIAKLDDIKDCEGDADCVEAEVTPHETFRDNPWFSSTDESAVREGRKVCTYGPWVWEEAHGNRPEIHPSEVIWWRDRGKGDARYLLLVQDASRRFHTEGGFSVRQPPPDWWKPWSHVPRDAAFSLTFEAPLDSGPPVELAVEELASGQVATSQDSAARRDADDGKRHRVVLDGKPLLIVHETQTRDDDIGVTFDRVCVDSSANRILGYLVVRTRVGRVDPDGNEPHEGHHVLRVAPRGTEASARPPAEPQDRVAAALELRDGSLRRTRRNGDLGLVADYILRLDEARRKGLTVTARAGGATLEARRTPQMASALGMFRGVSVFDTVAFHMTDASDASVWQQTVPPVRLAAHLLVEPVSPFDAAAAQARTAFLDGEDLVLPDGLDFIRVRRWRVTARPVYGPTREGAVHLEDEGLASAELNRVLLEGTRDDRVRAFGESPVFDFSWEFSGADYTADAPVSVSVADQADPQEIDVSVEETGAGTASTLRVTFPEAADGLLQLVVDLQVSDSFDNAASVSGLVTNHALRGDSVAMVDPLMALLADAVGAPRTTVADRSRADFGPRDPRVRDPQMRRMRFLRLLGTEAAADGLVDYDEWRTLVEATRQAVE